MRDTERLTAKDVKMICEVDRDRETRTMGLSQEEYCRGCILRPGCNVVLKDGESCGDKYDVQAKETSNL